MGTAGPARSLAENHCCPCAPMEKIPDYEKCKKTENHVLFPLTSSVGNGKLNRYYRIFLLKHSFGGRKVVPRV